jgi:hypothetical protein
VARPLLLALIRVLRSARRLRLTAAQCLALGQGLEVEMSSGQNWRQKQADNFGVLSQILLNAG